MSKNGGSGMFHDHRRVMRHRSDAYRRCPFFAPTVPPPPPTTLSRMVLVSLLQFFGAVCCLVKPASIASGCKAVLLRIASFSASLSVWF